LLWRVLVWRTARISMSSGSRRARRAALAMLSRMCRRRSAAPVIDGSEPERGADIDGLAVAPLVLERGHLVPLDLVADAARQGDAPGQGIRAAKVDPAVVALAQAGQRMVGSALGADGDAAGEFLERI